MSRRGFSLLVVLVCLGVALSLAVAMLSASGHRRLGFQHRQRLVQAREYALGARSLPPGTRIEVDGWSVEHRPDGGCRAGRGGEGWTIAPDGVERAGWP